MQKSEELIQLIKNAKDDVKNLQKLAIELKETTAGLACLADNPQSLRELFEFAKTNNALRDAIGEALITSNGNGWTALHYITLSRFTGLPFLISLIHGNEGLYTYLGQGLTKKATNGDTPVVLMKKPFSKYELRDTQAKLAQDLRHDYDLLRILKEAGVFQGAEKELHHLGIF